MVELFRELFIDNYYKNRIDFIPRYFLFNPLYPECDINFDGELIEDESEYDNFHHCSYVYDINNATYDSYRNIEEVMLLEDLSDVISHTFSQLNELEEAIIRMRYGIGEDDTEYTLEEIARVLGRSRERVRQIESSGIKKLKHPKVSKMLKVYLNEDMNGDFKDTFLHNKQSLYERFIFIAEYVINHFINKNNKDILDNDYTQAHMQRHNLILIPNSQIELFKVIFAKMLLEESSKVKYIEIDSNLHNNFIYKALRKIGIYHNYFIPEDIAIKIDLNHSLIHAIICMDNKEHILYTDGKLVFYK
jgi:RNA polymerase sigma factor (sigma-70 family)